MVLKLEVANSAKSFLSSSELCGLFSALPQKARYVLGGAKVISNYSSCNFKNQKMTGKREHQEPNERGGNYWNS